MRLDFPHYESLNERTWRVRAAALYALVIGPVLHLFSHR
jgi:hypothetical protein